jgi:hypothetical protein
VLGARTARVARVCHSSYDIPRIGQDQQVILNRTCPVGSSDSDPILGPGIPISARADDPCRQPRDEAVVPRRDSSPAGRRYPLTPSSPPV